MDFAYRDEARKVAAIEQAAKDKEEQKQKKLQEDYNLKQGPPTGIKTYDEAIASFYRDAVEKNNELYKKERSGQELTPEEYSLKRKLQQLPETIQLMSKAYQEQNSRYLEGLKTGKLKRDTDYEMVVNGLGKNARAFIDSEGNPVIGIDKDNDGKIDFLHNDFNGISIQPKRVENVDLEESIKSVSDNLESKRKVTDNGITQVTKEGLPLSVAKSTATRMAVNPNGTLTPLAVSYFYDLGVKNPEKVTDAQLDDFEKFLTGRLMNSKKNIDETDVDVNASIALSKDKKDNKKVTTTPAANIVSFCLLLTPSPSVSSSISLKKSRVWLASSDFNRLETAISFASSVMACLVIAGAGLFCCLACKACCCSSFFACSFSACNGAVLARNASGALVSIAVPNVPPAVPMAVTASTAML